MAKTGNNLRQLPAAFESASGIWWHNEDELAASTPDRVGNMRRRLRGLVTSGVIRAEVLRFAVEMERKLRQHDGTKGEDAWKGDDPGALAVRAVEEGRELIEACANLETQRYPTEEHYAAVRGEAADVGNMAMMTADAAGTLYGDVGAIVPDGWKPGGGS